MARATEANKTESTVFPPWFLSRKVLHQVQQLLPSIYHKRLFAYFQRFGCIRCSCKRVPYCSNGLCRRCTGLLNDRLRRCDQAMAREYREATTLMSDRFVSRITSARTLLADLMNEKHLKGPRNIGHKRQVKSIEYRPVIQIR